MSRCVECGSFLNDYDHCLNAPDGETQCLPEHEIVWTSKDKVWRITFEDCTELYMAEKHAYETGWVEVHRSPDLVLCRKWINEQDPT